MVSRVILYSISIVALLSAINWYKVSTRQPKKVWMSLLTNGEYLESVLTLDYSIRKYGSRYPFVVFHPSTLEQHVLFELNKRQIQTKEVNLLLPKQHKDYGPDERFYDCWSKLLPHGMVEYDRIVELDADMLLTGNADELMEMELPMGSMAAAHACVCNPRGMPHYPEDWTPENCAYTQQHSDPETAHDMLHAISNDFGTSIMNGGLQVLNPNQKVFNDILNIMSNETLTATFDFADQSLLSHYFKDHWISLPYIYNALKTMRSAHATIWHDERVKIVHYILNDKPWNDPLRERSEFVPNQWWWEHNNERLKIEKQAEVKKATEDLIARHPTIIFSKSYCPHCRAAKQLLSERGEPYQIVELDKVEDGFHIQQYLAMRNKVNTVPQVSGLAEHLSIFQL